MGHQGYEYVDLGRLWQAALFVGLLLWLFLIARTAIPALKQKGMAKSLIVLYLLSTTGIALFYSPGLFWGMRSHISVVEYWSARSPEFLQTDLMQTLRWMRMVGDTVFAVGAIAFVYFALDLMLRKRRAKVMVRTDVAVETV